MTKHLHHCSKGLFLCHVCCLKQISSGNPLGRKKERKKKKIKQSPTPKLCQKLYPKSIFMKSYRLGRSPCCVSTTSSAIASAAFCRIFTPLNQQITSQRQPMCQRLVRTMCLAFSTQKGQNSCWRATSSLSFIYSHTSQKAQL